MSSHTPFRVAFPVLSNPPETAEGLPQHSFTFLCRGGKSQPRVLYLEAHQVEGSLDHQQRVDPLTERLEKREYSKMKHCGMTEIVTVERIDCLFD